MTKLHLPLLAAAAALALGTAAGAATANDRGANNDRAAPNDHRGQPDSDSANFLKAAIQSDNSEIMLGRMAIENPTASPAVKRYGQMLIDDHTQHLHKGQALAQANGVKPPDGPTMGADAESAKLHLLKGDAFDKEFAQYMMSDHQNDIAEFKKEAARHDGDISKFAEETLPTLRKHLDAALNLQKR